MDYKQLSIRAHQNAVNHGFWENRPSNKHFLMLVITEVAEIVEADRKGRYFTGAGVFEKYDGKSSFAENFERCVKNTVEDEMADVVIRLIDLAAALDINVAQRCPAWKFSNMTFAENAFRLCAILTDEGVSVTQRIGLGVRYIERWAAYLKIDIEWHIENKMKYNENRPYRHGKNY